MAEREPSAREENEERIRRLREAMYSRKLEPLIKEKPRRELELTRPPVGEDFVHEEKGVGGAVAAPSRVRFMRALVNWAVAAGIAFFIGAAGFFLYFFFIGEGSGTVSPGNIDISVSGPL